jgi:hypothetical protein
MFIDTPILESFATAFVVIKTYWWVVLPFIMYLATMGLWDAYVKTRYSMGLKWVLLELKPPPDVLRSPKIAENIFSALHAIQKNLSWKDKFFGGKSPEYFSFEIVGNSGEMKFLVRTLESHRPLVEAQFFAQYPDAEIYPVEDYVKELPKMIPDDQYDLFGTEIILAREDAYPIKTYPEFEEQQGKDEYRRTDPLAPIAEVMTSTVPGEHVWLHLIIRPTDDKWVKDAKAETDKLQGLDPKPAEKDWFTKFMFMILRYEEVKPEKKETNITRMTPGQKEVLEKVEEKIAKLGFEGGYRFVYIAKKDVFNRARITSILGALKQLSANNLNAFKPNGETGVSDKGWLYQFFPSDKGFFAAAREFEKKVKMYDAAIKRKFVKKNFILNTEELATIFHLPSLNIKAPGFPRVEAKRGQPPSSLPHR